MTRPDTVANVPYMRVTQQRQTTLSVKVTPAYRRLIETLAAKLTLRGDRRYTLTDVMEEALCVLAAREKVKLEK